MSEFRMLGPLEVVEQDGVVRLGAGKERALLALLLTSADQVVPTDRIVDELWPEEPPAQAVKAVQAYVSRLRRRLGESRVVTRAQGYALILGSSTLDARRLEELVAAASLEPPEGAAATLREALSLFRGPVLADVRHEPFAQPEIRRLEELRLAALEARVEADLALGRHAELVPELEGHVVQHPTRDRFRLQLALALYRAGRQVDALTALRDARRMLVEQLGLEPTEDFRRLERAILEHDPALAAPAGRAPSRPAPPGPGRRRRRGAVGVIVGLAAASAVVLIVLTSGAEQSPLVAAPNSVAVIDSATNMVVATTPVLERPTLIRLFGDSAWVMHPDARTITRLRRGDRMVDRTIGIGGAPGGMVVNEHGLWIADALKATVTLVDPEHPQSRRTFGTRATPLRLEHSDAGALGDGFGTLWLASGERTLTRIDPVKLVTRAAIRDVATVGPPIGGIAFGPGAVWVGGLRTVQRLDPRSNTVIAVVEPALFRVSGLAASAEGAWVTDVGSDQVFLIDSARSQVAGATKVGGQPLGIAYGAGAVWVANSGDGTVSRLDPATGRLVATIAVGGSPTGIAATEGEVWVTVS